MDCNNLVCITTSVKGIILVYLRLTYFIRVWVNVASSSADSFRVCSFPLVIKLNTIKYCFLVSNLQWKIPTISGRLQYFTHTKSIGIFQQSLWEQHKSQTAVLQSHKFTKTFVPLLQLTKNKIIVSQFRKKRDWNAKQFFLIKGANTRLRKWIVQNSFLC